MTEIGKIVTIHSLFEIGFWLVMLAWTRQVLISNNACEEGTSPTTSDISVVRRGRRAQHGWSEVCWRRDRE